MSIARLAMRMERGGSQLSIGVFSGFEFTAPHGARVVQGG